MAHSWRWLILSGTPNEFRWDITEEASVRRFQLPEVSATEDIEAAERSGDIVQAFFFWMSKSLMTSRSLTSISARSLALTITRRCVNHAATW